MTSRSFSCRTCVLPARPGKKSDALSELAAAGVEILADDFSLRERGIAESALSSGVKPAPIDIVVDHLAEGRKAIWH